MQIVTEMGPRLGFAATCAAMGLPRATFYRRLKPKPEPGMRTSHRALGADERRAVLDVLHEPRFADLASAEVYAMLLDEGRYLCSERTMYRILAENAEVRERRAQLRHPAYKAPELLARAQPALELGHHQASRPDQVDLLLSVRDPRRVQPVRGRLDAGAPRVGGARATADR